MPEMPDYIFEASELGWPPGFRHNWFVLQNEKFVFVRSEFNAGQFVGWRYASPNRSVLVVND